VDYDACPIYELPNVFTPNADQYNDFLVPINYPSTNPKANVDRIELTIFNRWGNVVFETADPAINWDGKNQRTGQDCADGTYFYVCEVFFQGFDGPVQQRLQGSITIIR
jgi:gliding motility-associated-like protein